MEIQEWKSMGPMAKLLRELQQLDLMEHVGELEAVGFTVIPPEKVGPPEYHEEMRDALVRTLDRRFGGRSWDGENQIVRLLLLEDRAFERLVLNPAGLGLVQYLLGTNCILSLMDGWVKGKGDARTPTHVDFWDFTRKSLLPEPNSANFNYLATDYSKAEGSLSFVPGSHRWRRGPTAAEVAEWADLAHPIEAPAGSMVIWGDYTWHGSYPRQVDGNRLMMLGTYSRPFMQTQEPFRQLATDEMLARNPKRFAGLMDVYGPFPFGTLGVDAGRLMANVHSGALDVSPYYSLFDTEPAGDAASVRPDYDYATFDVAEFDRTNDLQKKRAAAMFKASQAKEVEGSSNGSAEARQKART